MKRRILFVDDEPNVLGGLKRMLHPMHREWEMVFTESGREALAALAEASFDVVVSDMRMPGMDGAELLTEVMRLHPQTVRIVLSGHAEQASVLRSIGPTHQYLAKPCDPELLKGVIARACALRDLLTDEPLRRLVSQMSTIPSLPRTYVKIVEALQSADVSTRQVGEIISGDVGMTAKVLQLVNSAFFGLQRHISAPTQAATLLGIETLKALVLSVHIFAQLDHARIEGLCLDTLWNHSVATGALAKRLAVTEDCPGHMRDHALMGGLVHDAGKLVIAANLPERYRNVLAVAREERLVLWEAERRLLGTSHAEVGAYLLGLWGLPDPIVEAVAFHHRPGECSQGAFVPLTLVHVADVLEQEQDAAARGRGAGRLDDEYLERVGLTGRIPEWRELQRSALQEKATS